MLNEQKCEHKIFDEYVGVSDSLIEEYTERFSDFDEHTSAMKLVFEPHLVDLYPRLLRNYKWSYLSWAKIISSNPFLTLKRIP